MPVLALDLGTTSWKAGIVDGSDAMPHVARIPTPSLEDAGAMLPSLKALLLQLPEDARMAVTRVALTGMAEAGLLLDAKTLLPRSPLLMWHDRRTEAIFAAHRDDPQFADRRAITGLPNSYKYGVYKMLYLLEAAGLSPCETRWLGAVEYAVFLLTGACAAEPTLAARTYAYDILQDCWDEAFLDYAGLAITMLPPLVPSGAPVGEITALMAREIGLPQRIPVHLCGHDHLCAAYGVGAALPGRLFGSLGTAQVLLATRAEKRLDEADTVSGLSFGPTVTGEGLHVLGSIQSAGGSVSLLNRLLYGGDGYGGMLDDAAQMPYGPSGLLYFPYLSGSGAPHLDAAMRGGFLGLSAGTSRGQLALAVYEGIAMESRLILETPAMGHAEALTVSGGLTAHPRFLQAMADVLRLPVTVAGTEEAALLGAARLVSPLPEPDSAAIHHPCTETSEKYDTLYRGGYLPMQGPLRTLYHQLAKEG